MSSQANKENTEPDNINVGLVATITVVGALLVVSTAAAVTALVRSESNAYGNEVGAYSNLGSVKRLKQEQRAKLEAAPGWSDRSKGLVSMPIDRAMTTVVTDIQKNPFFATPTAPKQNDDAGAPAAPAVDSAAAPAPDAPKEEGAKGEETQKGEPAKGEEPKKGEPAKVEQPKKGEPAKVEELKKHETAKGEPKTPTEKH